MFFPSFFFFFLLFFLSSFFSIPQKPESLSGERMEPLDPHKHYVVVMYDVGGGNGGKSLLKPALPHSAAS